MISNFAALRGLPGAREEAVAPRGSAGGAGVCLGLSIVGCRWFYKSCSCVQESKSSKPLVPVDAIENTALLREQLKTMGEFSADLDVLEAQREIKARAREEKAARQLAKGSFGCTISWHYLQT